MRENVNEIQKNIERVVDSSEIDLIVMVPECLGFSL